MSQVDRFVIMVDAGYLYAAAGELCCGTSSREKLRLDPAKVHSSFVDLCRKQVPDRHLRTYWYDGARDGIPTREHLDLVSQRGIKLRLGRLTNHGQKGVDSRIVRDLILLPRSGVVGTIFLLSGDEDVREGVAEAQELGVSVVLLGIEPIPGRFNQAQSLIHEADEHIVLSRSVCSEFLMPKEIQTVPYTPQATSAPSLEKVRTIGREFSTKWRSQVDPQKVVEVGGVRPRIPQALDAELLREASERFGADLDDRVRRELRNGFWEDFPPLETE